MLTSSKYQRHLLQWPDGCLNQTKDTNPTTCHTLESVEGKWHGHSRWRYNGHQHHLWPTKPSRYERLPMVHKGEIMGAEGGSKKKKRRLESYKRHSSGGKNALMQLHELRPGLKFEVLGHGGAIHAPVFQVGVEVDGMRFEGVGASKQKAKLVVARQVLRTCFVQFPNAEDAHRVLIGEKQVKKANDFTEDKVDSDDNLLIGRLFDEREDDVRLEGKLDVSKVEDISDILPSCRRIPGYLPNGKNPVMVLNELRPGARCEVVTESGQSHNKSFTIRLTVDGKEFEGSARNKRSAKARAALAALRGLFHLQECVEGGGGCVTGGDTGWKPYESSQQFADAISNLVYEKFRQVTNGMSSQLVRYKVLAAFILTHHQSPDDKTTDMKVVSLATGSKCINGEYLSDEGLALNDCHAEVIARRALLMYLYSELEASKRGEDTAGILEHCGEKLGLKQGVRLHLYTSTSPCGDGRLFSPHESNLPDGHEKGSDSHPNRRARGLLRTKIEGGEGTIPVADGDSGGGWYRQPWDGVMAGSRLLTMSCSDKIMMWNVAGVQGALLSTWMQPVCLSSVVVGSLYHSQHLCRALYSRLGSKNTQLTVNRPFLCTVTSPEYRQPGKAPTISINWAESGGDDAVEVVTTTTGRLQGGGASRLSKRSMLSRYNKMLRLESREGNGKLCSYHDVKVKSSEYMRRKHEMYEKVKALKLGRWVKKPVEQDDFIIS